MFVTQQRKIYQSENGDSWWLCREENDVFVLHEANVPSGGRATRVELSQFLQVEECAPEKQALLQLISELTRCPL
jgi:hypothetical protein